MTNIGRDCGYGSGHSVGCGSGSNDGDLNSDVNSGGTSGFSSGSKSTRIYILKYLASRVESQNSVRKKFSSFYDSLHQNITKKSRVRAVTSNSPMLMSYD